MRLNEAIQHAKEKAEESRENIIGGCNLEPFEVHCNSQCIKCAEEHEQLAEWLEELQNYKNLEEQGYLLTLPCRHGEMVYACEDPYGTGEITVTEYQITSISIELAEWDSILFNGLCVYDGDLEIEFSSQSVGRTVFLTEKEAKTAIQLMKQEVGE